MANRHRSRSIVLQTLFEWDSAGCAMEQDALQKRLDANTEEFGQGTADEPFMKQLLSTVVAKRSELDKVIEKAAPEWPVEKISVIDRNILRLGLSELLFADRTQVPAKVAINEAIELAKTFGSETSGRFVNGVLGAVYVELGEPGKDEVSKKKKKVPYEKLPVQHLAGAVVYAEHEGKTYLAFVHDIFGHWTISKGKVGDKEEFTDETIEEAAVREIHEEMGVDITVQKKLGENEYVANAPEEEGGKRRKHVTYFLAQAPFAELKLGPSGGLDDAQWFPLSQVGNLNFYEDTLKIIVPAINALAQKSDSDDTAGDK